jgi:RES domain-containing protein
VTLPLFELSPAGIFKDAVSLPFGKDLVYGTKLKWWNYAMVGVPILYETFKLGRGLGLADEFLDLGDYLPKGIPKGITFEGTIYRAVNPKYEDSAWKIHAGNLGANHRYSSVGRGALYSGTSEKAVLGELKYYNIDPGSVSWVSKKVKVRNILDLSNPAVRKQLGITKSQITGNSYNLTQAIGDFARGRYSGLLVPSARAKRTFHLILFD